MDYFCMTQTTVGIISRDKTVFGAGPNTMERHV